MGWGGGAGGTLGQAEALGKAVGSLGEAEALGKAEGSLGEAETLRKAEGTLGESKTLETERTLGLEPCMEDESLSSWGLSFGWGMWILPW